MSKVSVGHHDRPVAAIEVDDLVVSYGEQTALRGVTIEVREGSVTALLGPNGAGKTTLLKAIAGLQRTQSGSIKVGGKDVTKDPAYRRVREGVCLIPEGRGIFRGLSVRENLLLQVPTWRRGTDIDKGLNAFPALKDRLSQTAGTMSGGQQQMLALARCYLSDPSVILLDEVSMGLAPLVVDQIFASIDELAAQGIALLLVEQYVDRALDLADVTYVLNRGTVVSAGSADDVNRDALVRDYLGADLST